MVAGDSPVAQECRVDIVGQGAFHTSSLRRLKAFAPNPHLLGCFILRSQNRIELHGISDISKRIT